LIAGALIAGALIAGAFIAGVAAPLTAHAADLFMLDQRYGSIAFSVDHFGMFTSLGNFPRFLGKLLIDRLHPEQTRIDVEADATTVTVPWPDGTDLLRGSDFFDIAHYPAVRFVSDTIKGLDPRHFQINGMLEIRGVTHPLTLDATLKREHADPVTGTEIADFSVTGTLSRADYGMTTQPIMISDHVRLLIDARIELPAQPR
jgi:polyisoprenoid-binding protein YceI